jgi:hypothetical protein
VPASDDDARGAAAGGDRSEQSWRAGPPPRSRLGERLFQLGGSLRHGLRLLLISVVLLAAGGASVAHHLSTTERPFAWLSRPERDASHAGRPLFVLSLFLLLPAGLYFGHLAWRESRGAVGVWREALELHARGRRRFLPWGTARSWRRAGDEDVVIEFARDPDLPGERIAVTCESRTQREAIVALLIEHDAPHDPWLTDPREG